MNNITLVNGAVVVVVLLVLGAAVFVWRRARRNTHRAPLLSVTLFLAAVMSGLSVLGAVAAALVAVVPNAWPIVTMPVQTYWPLPTTWPMDATEPTVFSGGFTQAQVSVAEVSPGAQALWIAGDVTGYLLQAAIAGMVALVCFQLLRGAAFSRLIVRAALVTAAIVLVGVLPPRSSTAWRAG